MLEGTVLENGAARRQLPNLEQWDQATVNPRGSLRSHLPAGTQTQPSSALRIHLQPGGLGLF